MMASDMSTSRRDFLRNTAITTAALASTAAHPVFAAAQQVTAQSTSKPSPIQLGMSSYTFREFDRARVIDFMKELKLANLNAKDVKDHLPISPPEATAQAVAAYARSEERRVGKECRSRWSP